MKADQSDEFVDPFLGLVLSETYRIERVLGEGGMSRVYEAAHLRLPRRFAVKVLCTELTDEWVSRLRREAMVISQLNHRHVVEVIDFNYTAKGVPYIVMELLVGESLAMRLRRVRRLNVEATGMLLTQVGSALHAAHRAGVIHRDLKPENIFLCVQGSHPDFVKVMDFGVSRVISATRQLTLEHTILGTPWYMAPEQVRGKTAEADQRTDVFALGVILYEMLSGQRPFEAERHIEVFESILEHAPEQLHVVESSVPKRVSRVIHQALSKKPEERYRSVKVLVQEYFEAAFGRHGQERGAASRHRDWWKVDTQPREYVGQILEGIESPHSDTLKEVAESKDKTLPPILRRESGGLAEAPTGPGLELGPRGLQPVESDELETKVKSNRHRIDPAKGSI